MPSGVVTHLEARMLRRMVNREIHPIRCAESCKQKFMKGMRIGDLCAETGHFGWALKVWRYTAELIEWKDYIDWRNVCFNDEWMSLRDVISETECELLYRRCSDLWKHLGHPEEAWWNEELERLTGKYFGTTYYTLYYERYNDDYDPFHTEWEEMMAELEADVEREEMFAAACEACGCN